MSSYLVESTTNVIVDKGRITDLNYTVDRRRTDISQELEDGRVRSERSIPAADISAREQEASPAEVDRLNDAKMALNSILLDVLTNSDRWVPAHFYPKSSLVQLRNPPAGSFYDPIHEALIVPGVDGVSFYIPEISVDGYFHFDNIPITLE